MKIEFLCPDDSDIIYVKDGDNMQRLEERADIIDMLYYNVKDNYPEAFDALFKLYGRAANHKFLMMRRFIKCNFSKHDSVLDFDGEEMHFEKVFCPLRGECLHDQIICNPKFNSNISPAELQAMELIADNLTDSEIGDRLYKSEWTISKQRKSILKKLGLKNKQDIADYYRKHFNK
jgi:DNA-binding CsgD family transcriptional regulator